MGDMSLRRVYVESKKMLAIYLENSNDYSISIIFSTEKTYVALALVLIIIRNTSIL